MIFQSMETGHPVMSTVHADTINRLVQRLVGDPINIPKTSIGNVDVVIIQRKIRGKHTHMQRIVTSINEIIGYDQQENVFRYIPLFYWNSIQNEFVYRGHGNSHLFNTKAALSRGLAHSETKQIYDELDTREKLLQALVDLGIFGYFSVWKIIQKVESIGIKNIYNPIQFIKNFLGENESENQNTYYYEDCVTSV